MASDIAVLLGKHNEGQKLTPQERKRVKALLAGKKRHMKLVLKQTESDLAQMAELRFIKKMTWKQVGEVLGIPEGTLAARISRHPEVFWAAVDRLFEAAEEEVRRDVRSARLRALRGVSDTVDEANKRLEKIITSPESQDSVAMTAIKHVHGSLGVSEKAERPLSGEFKPQGNWKERASDLLGVALAGVEKAKQLQGPQIEAEVEVLGEKGEKNAQEDGARAEEGGTEEVSGEQGEAGRLCLRNDEENRLDSLDSEESPEAGR